MRKAQKAFPYGALVSMSEAACTNSPIARSYYVDGVHVELSNVQRETNAILVRLDGQFYLLQLLNGSASKAFNLL
jgi:hypothetical protein